MTFKIIIPILVISLFSCNDISTDKTDPQATLTTSDTTIEDQSKILQKLEQSSGIQQLDNLGELIQTISFNIKTDNLKDFENGVIPWASIENAKKDLMKVVDGNEKVISESQITIIIDYPLTNVYKFELKSKTGFTRIQLLKEISEHYYKLYDEEEKTATIKTLPQEKRTMYNRNQTNGKYGIWGHDISDLVLAEIFVHRSSNGQIILELNIES